MTIKAYQPKKGLVTDYQADQARTDQKRDAIHAKHVAEQNGGQFNRARALAEQIWATRGGRLCAAAAVSIAAILAAGAIYMNTAMQTPHHKLTELEATTEYTFKGPATLYVRNHDATLQTTFKDAADEVGAVPVDGGTLKEGEYHLAGYYEAGSAHRQDNDNAGIRVITLTQDDVHNSIQTGPFDPHSEPFFHLVIDQNNPDIQIVPDSQTNNTEQAS